MSDRPRVLLIEDTTSLARLYEQYLADSNVEVITVGTGREGLDELEEQVPAVILLDLELPDMNGLDILKHVHEQEIPTSVVVITAHGSINVAVEAMRTGAYDFIVKPFNANRLRVTVNNALERQELSRIVATIKAGARNKYQGFIGRSLSMQAVYRIIESAAASKATVFITGESGTGKEVCAEAIHRQSQRAKGPFVAINCGAIPRELMESEIFGHKKGAFTGATADREGAASSANGGTLFLDEIGEMPLDLQTKLLRFIQTGSFQKVGGNKLEKVDVRFVCATNRDVRKEVERGNFREDLYYRLHVIPIAMPPLREREDDMILIAQALLNEYAREEERHFKSFSGEVEAVLRGYDWPGNVRELQNVLRNVVVLNDGEKVTLDMLPPPLDQLNPQTARPARPQGGSELTGNQAGLDPDASQPLQPLWKTERDVIEDAIRRCDGNIPRAAEILEVAPSTIYRKRASWGGEA